MLHIPTQNALFVILIVSQLLFQQQLRAGDEILLDKFDPPMSLIPGGEYVVGWDKANWRIKRAWPGSVGDDPKIDIIRNYFIHAPITRLTFDTLPGTRSVTVKPFHICKYEVTESEYSAFCRAVGKRLPDSGHKANNGSGPAAGISGEDAIQYCKWLSQKTRRKYRLPDNDEWEIAAQGRCRNTFPWGNNFPKSKEEFMELKAKPNGYGIYFMGSSVAEMCRPTAKLPYFGDKLSELDQRTLNDWSRTVVFVRGGSDQPGFSKSDDAFLCSWWVIWTRSKEMPSFVGFRLAADL